MKKMLHRKCIATSFSGQTMVFTWLGRWGHVCPELDSIHQELSFSTDALHHEGQFLSVRLLRPPTPFQGRPYYWNLAVSLYLGMPGFSELIRSSSPTSPRVWALAALWILIPKPWCCSLRTATFPVSLGLSHTLWPYAPQAGTLFQTLNSWCLSWSNWTMCVITLKNIPEGKLGFNLWPKSRIRNWFVPSKNKPTNEWMDPTENTSDYMKFHACLLSVSLKCFKTSFLSSKEVCPRNKINWLQTLVVTTVPSALPSLCSGP